MNAPAKLEQQSRTTYRFTLDDVFKMIEAGVLAPDARVELIEGELIQMAPQNAPHMEAKRALAKLLYSALPETVALHIEGTLRLAPSTAPEPDLFMHIASVRPDQVRGPDVLLLIEVSDTTLGDDLGPKARLYARYGVPEYWVLDVASRKLTVHTDPRPDGYARLRLVEPDEPVAPERLPGVELRLADLPSFE
jgi:Uma2 family endonuclease